MVNIPNLEKYCTQFFGYGNLNSDYWFIGLEEGLTESQGSDAEHQLTQRMHHADSLVNKATTDLQLMHKILSQDFWFRANGPIQPTWGKIAHALLSTNGIQPTRECRRSYQRSSLGRTDSNHCLLELLPLPMHAHQKLFKNDRNIYFNFLSNHPWLNSYTSYKEYWSHRRAKQIGEMIKVHRPKYVVMYGLSAQKYWETIANANNLSPGYVEIERSPKFIIISHPVSRGSTLEAWGKLFIT